MARYFIHMHNQLQIVNFFLFLKWTLSWTLSHFQSKNKTVLHFPFSLICYHKVQHTHLIIVIPYNNALIFDQWLEQITPDTIIERFRKRNKFKWKLMFYWEMCANTLKRKENETNNFPVLVAYFILLRIHRSGTQFFTCRSTLDCHSRTPCTDRRKRIQQTPLYDFPPLEISFEIASVRINVLLHTELYVLWCRWWKRKNDCRNISVFRQLTSCFSHSPIRLLFSCIANPLAVRLLSALENILSLLCALGHPQFSSSSTIMITVTSPRYDTASIFSSRFEQIRAHNVHKAFDCCELNPCECLMLDGTVLKRYCVLQSVRNNIRLYYVLTPFEW